MVDELRHEGGVTLVLGNPSQRVLLALKRAHLDRKIGRANIHVHMADAVVRARSIADAKLKQETVAGV